MPTELPDSLKVAETSSPSSDETWSRISQACQDQLKANYGQFTLAEKTANAGSGILPGIEWGAGAGGVIGAVVGIEVGSAPGLVAGVGVGGIVGGWAGAIYGFNRSPDNAEMVEKARRDHVACLSYTLPLIQHR